MSVTMIHYCWTDNIIIILSNWMCNLCNKKMNGIINRFLILICLTWADAKICLNNLGGLIFEFPFQCIYAFSLFLKITAKLKKFGNRCLSIGVCQGVIWEDNLIKFRNEIVMQFCKSKLWNLLGIYEFIIE